MGSESRSKGKRSNSNEHKEQKRGSDRGRSSSSGSSSSRSKRSRSRRSESRSNRGERGGRYQGGRREPEKISPNAKLFVTNIDSKFSQDELDRELRILFEPYGAIKQIIVKTKQGSSNSYCFIEYQEVDSAIKAQEELKGKDFKGKELKVEFGRGERKAEDRRSDKCYICHKEGHFAKECRYNRFTGNSNYDDKGRRDDRDRGRDRDYRDRDYDRDRDYREKDRRGDRRRKYSRSSSSSKSYRHRHDRDREDYRRRDTRRSPEKRSSNYHSSNSRRY